MASSLQYHYVNNFTLQNGINIPELKLAYRTYGKLNQAADNAILFPTYFTGTDLDNARIIGRDHALNPDKYFIIVPNLFGNGVSSSPSNMPKPLNGANFPALTISDNVRAQASLLDQLNVTSLVLVLGWSMGGLQSYQWCVQYPEKVKRALIICATAKTSEHNQVFLEGVKSALTADQNYRHGDYGSQSPVGGLRAFGRVYASWAYSPAFFRNQRYRELGFESVEELLVDWEQDHLNWDANDLLAMLETWRSADISQSSKSFSDALRGVIAKTVLMPCEDDLYFRYEDNLEELNYLRDGHYAGFKSDFGHCAAGPGRFSLESSLIDETIKSLLGN